MRIGFVRLFYQKPKLNRLMKSETTLTFVMKNLQKNSMQKRLLNKKSNIFVRNFTNYEL